MNFPNAIKNEKLNENFKFFYFNIFFCKFSFHLEFCHQALRCPQKIQFNNVFQFFNYVGKAWKTFAKINFFSLQNCLLFFFFFKFERKNQLRSARRCSFRRGWMKADASADDNFCSENYERKKSF